ncbi:hypothetical protein IQ07DRAFT_344259 [Pyrenochaeta sp. DS3sAY3a]|nr:hypothetical protein IQ07DRAFT_344259 [Pyrenochaeta sp. DS3sAY3a]
MKCLPADKLPLAKGNILHDWHAEVLAFRAFNRFLLDQCLLVSTPPYPTSDFLRQRANHEISGSEQQPFTIREDVSIYMYCSEAPCGDASMELVMDAQEDATPWTSAPPLISNSPSTDTDIGDETQVSALRGRSNFSLLGAVRCKPSRPDAPPTLSKSCTDKIALKQTTSLLSSTTAHLISPRNAYIKTLVLPSSQYVPAACDRAFSPTGRMASLSDSTTASWNGGYKFQPFEVKPTTREFSFSRRSIAPGQKAVPSNLSAVWTPSWQETLIGGVLQGRKQFDPRGASAICRRSMWAAAMKVAVALSLPIVGGALGSETYKAVKEGPALEDRRRVKRNVRDALKGWVRNTGDEDFSLADISKT